jgi:hypothetical protein
MNLFKKIVIGLAVLGMVPLIWLETKEQDRKLEERAGSYYLRPIRMTDGKRLLFAD